MSDRRRGISDRYPVVGAVRVHRDRTSIGSGIADSDPRCPIGSDIERHIVGRANEISACSGKRGSTRVAGHVPIEHVPSGRLPNSSHRVPIVNAASRIVVADRVRVNRRPRRCTVERVHLAANQNLCPPGSAIRVLPDHTIVFLDDQIPQLS